MRRLLCNVSAFAVVAAVCGGASADPIKTVFMIALENENFIQPDNKFTASNEQIFQNPNAPFINSLINGTATSVDVGGVSTNVSAQTAYAANYHNVLAPQPAAPSGSHIHPSAPNYIWSEGGANYGVFNDNTPYGPGGSNQNTTAHLSGLLQSSGQTWKSYQEDTDLAKDVNGKLTSTVLPQSQWSVPLNNVNNGNGTGTNAAPGYTNPYNGSHQYDYAAKHNPMAYFTDTNGGNDTTPANPLSQNYAPLQQLQTDLTNNTVAQYNFITPDQFNDMHSALSGAYKGLTASNDKRIKQGDDFLSQIIPMIMASDAYKNDGAIVIWTDESEPDGVAGDNPDDLNHFLTEIVISPDAHPNVDGLPYASDVFMTHSSDLRTMQEIFHVGQFEDPSGPWLGDAANVSDLSDLFAAGAIPAIPEPWTVALFGLGVGLIGWSEKLRRSTRR